MKQPTAVETVLAAIVLFGPFAVLTSRAPAQEYLFNRADFPTGVGPRGLVTGDFNSDGALDLAVVNSADNTVSVLLSRTNGTFQAHVDYATGSGPNSVVTGDFNGDGKLDLAVANAGVFGSPGNTVSVLLGNGDGTFRAQLEYGTGAQPVSLIVGDFNGDGTLDLAVANNADNTISILLGKGDGTFQPHVEFSTGLGPNSVAVGDFNGDGKPDLVVSNGGSAIAGTVSVLLGNGDGTFHAHVDYPTTLNPVAVATGDFNGDGKLDLAVSGLNVAILLGNGDGTFKPSTEYGAGGFGQVVPIVVGDFNGDGKLDIARANATDSTVDILLGKGDGTFTSLGFGSAYGTLDVPVAITVADLNADGNLDLAVANSNGGVSILLGNGNGTFQSRSSSTAEGRFVTSGDFNGDGIPDLVVASTITGNTVSVLLGKGGGEFQAPVDYATGTGPYSVATGDFNRDGKLDLAVANYNSQTVSILLGKGDGTFQAQQQFATGPGPASVAVGDFNGDGKLDLAVANNGFGSGQTVSLLLGNGDGTFQQHQEFTTGLVPLDVIAADFNADGKLDLAVSTSQSGISILLGNGDGTFQTHVDYAPGSFGVAAGDFNGDGKLDLASLGNPGLWVLLGKVTGLLPLLSRIRQTLSLTPWR